jgi:hypothetical protein
MQPTNARITNAHVSNTHVANAHARSIEMNLLNEALSRIRHQELLREAEEQRVALQLHRSQRLRRRAARARRRAEHGLAHARLAHHRIS